MRLISLSGFPALVGFCRFPMLGCRFCFAGDRHVAQFANGLRQAGIGGNLHVEVSLVSIFLHALPVTVADSKFVASVRLLLLSGAPIPFRGHACVAEHTFAEIEAASNLILSVGVAVASGFAKPISSFRLARFHTLPFAVHGADKIHRFKIAVFGSITK